MARDFCKKEACNQKNHLEGFESLLTILGINLFFDMFYYLFIVCKKYVVLFDNQQYCCLLWVLVSLVRNIGGRVLHPSLTP